MTSVAQGSLTEEMTVSGNVAFENDGFPAEDSFRFGVSRTSNRLSVGNIDADLSRGEESTITGTVTNTGGNTLQDLELVFSPRNPELTVKQSSYAVGDLQQGEEARFEFPVELSDDAEPGPRIYSLQATYSNPSTGSKGSNSLSFSSTIAQSEGDFIVEAEGNVTAGSSTEYSIEVTNPSNSTYEDIDARIFTSDPVSADDDRAYIEELAPGESDELTFEVSASGEALEKNYPIRSDFRYDVGSDSKLSDTYRTGLEVTAPEESSSPLPLILLVVVVAGAAGFYLYRNGNPLEE